MQSKKYEPRIQEDMKLGSSVGANGTPTLFFNGRQLVGAQPFDRMRAVIDEELKKADALLGGAKPDARFYDRACDANVAAAPAAPVPAAAQAPAPGAVQKVDVRPDDPVRGNPRAPVTIVLFSDFQCPFCARVGPTLDEVERTYGDKVRIVWKHQPLPFHQQALPAAEAAEAAREQGKFWQMHDRLFASQRELSPDAYGRIARELGLDVKKFEAAVQSGKARARIQQDQQLASQVGAQGDADDVRERRAGRRRRSVRAAQGGHRPAAREPLSGRGGPPAWLRTSRTSPRAGRMSGGSRCTRRTRRWRGEAPPP